MPTIQYNHLIFFVFVGKPRNADTETGTSASQTRKEKNDHTEVPTTTSQAEQSDHTEHLNYTPQSHSEPREHTEPLKCTSQTQAKQKDHTESLTTTSQAEQNGHTEPLKFTSQSQAKQKNHTESPNPTPQTRAQQGHHLSTTTSTSLTWSAIMRIVPLTVTVKNILLNKKKERRLHKRLYTAVLSILDEIDWDLYYSGKAHTLTKMLLNLGNKTILNLVNNRTELKEKVEEAIDIDF